MGGYIGFIVVEFNQASHQPSVNYEDVYSELTDATERLDDEKRRTAEVGRRERHIVCVLVPCCRKCAALVEPGQLDDDGVCDECFAAAYAQGGRG